MSLRRRSRRARPTTRSGESATPVRKLGSLTAADRREHGDFVVVVQDGGVAVVGLVAVDPDTRAVEHGDELLAVSRPRAVEQFPEGRGVVAVVGAAGRLARLREQPEPDAQLRSS